MKFAKTAACVLLGFLAVWCGTCAVFTVLGIIEFAESTNAETLGDMSGAQLRSIAAGLASYAIYVTATITAIDCLHGVVNGEFDSRKPPVE